MNLRMIAWLGRVFLSLLATICIALPIHTASAETKNRAKNPPERAKKSSPAQAKRTPAKKAQRPGTQTSVSGPSYGDRADALAWASDAAARRNLDPVWVENAIKEARLVQRVRQLVKPAPQSFQKNWAVYRSRFIEPVRIQHGLRFWRANEAMLEKAEAQTGVPAHIIVGIIGVETIFGRDMGSYRVLDALATLAFDFPQEHPKASARQAFFREELEQYLGLCQRSGRDPKSLLGSYAGAMGLPQFMPSSWIKYAVDFDGDGQVDLLNSSADAIGSVANYLKEFGWQRGMPTRYPAVFAPNQTPEDKAALLGPDILPSFDAKDISSKGMLLGEAASAHTGKLALVEVFNGNAPPSYVIGTQNFYAITRYNWSSYYALAVIEFGEEVRELLASAKN